MVVKDVRFHLEPNLSVANCGECRPCCLANFFLRLANGTPSPPPDAPACVLRLTGHGLRCLLRFCEKHGLQSMTFQSQEGCCRMPELFAELLHCVWMVWSLNCSDTPLLRFGGKFFFCKSTKVEKTVKRESR